MPDTTTILSLAPGASYLAANELRKGQLFSKHKTSPILNQQIYAVYFILNKIYTLNPNYTGLDVSAQYLWELMGRWGVKAQSLSGGGGSVSPITPGSIIIPYDFQVAASGTLLVTGQTSVVLPDAWQGISISFYRGTVIQSQVNDGFSVYYSWDKTTRTLTLFNGAAVQDEFIQIVPVL